MLVTVIIPSYNHCLYVVQAIESVLDQDWPDIDLIVIDDGSRDGSPEVINNLHARRGGFRFIARENQGLIGTLNQGLSLARGDYFCELASDDYLPKDSIRNRLSVFAKFPEVVAVFANGHLVRDDIVTEECLVRDKQRRMFQEEDPIPYMLKGTLPVFSTGLFRTDILRELGGFDEEIYRYYEDLELPMRLSVSGKIKLLDEMVIYRRDHDTNVSKTTQHVRPEKLKCYNKLYKDPLFQRYKAEIRKVLVHEYVKYGRYLLNSPRNHQEELALLLNGLHFSLYDVRILLYIIMLKIKKVNQDE